MTPRPAVVAAAVAAALAAGCSSTSAPPPRAAPVSTASPSAPTTEPSASPTRLPQEQLAAETARAVSVPPPPLTIEGDLSIGGQPGTLNSGDVEQIQAAYDAALEAVAVLRTTPGMLRYTTPRTVEDFAPVTALMHPEVRDSYDGVLRAFLGSQRNDPAAPAPDEATATAVNDLSALGTLFLRGDGGTADEGGELGAEKRRVFGFGGAGAGAVQEVRVRSLDSFQAEGAGVAIQMAITGLYNTVDSDGGLLTTAVVTELWGVTMKQSDGIWLIAGWGDQGRLGRTVDRR